MKKKKKGKNIANGEDNRWKVKICYQDFVQTFPTNQAGSVCSSSHGDKEAALRQLSLGRQRLDRHPSPPGRVCELLTTSTAVVEGQWYYCWEKRLHVSKTWEISISFFTDLGENCINILLPCCAWHYKSDSVFDWNSSCMSMRVIADDFCRQKCCGGGDPGSFC